VTSSRTIECSARTTELEEYVAPTTAANGADPTEVDDEVVEGASRVSLRCPVRCSPSILSVLAAIEMLIAGTLKDMWVVEYVPQQYSLTALECILIEYLLIDASFCCSVSYPKLSHSCAHHALSES
jgi:hypothetical protein